MTDDEIEVVAEELAKISGPSSHRGREPGPLMRVVTDRYRDRARAAIAALNRLRTGRNPCADHGLPWAAPQESASRRPAGDVRPGATIVYRPLGDRRAYPYRIVEIQGDRAYLAPILRTCVGWVSIERLQAATVEKALES
jgi:hypothetical protein